MVLISSFECCITFACKCFHAKVCKLLLSAQIILAPKLISFSTPFYFPAWSTLIEATLWKKTEIDGLTQEHDYIPLCFKLKWSLNLCLWPLGNDSSKVTLRIHAIPPPDFLKPSRFHPQKNNIRTEWFTGVASTQQGIEEINLSFMTEVANNTNNILVICMMQRVVSPQLLIITAQFLEIISHCHIFSSCRPSVPSVLLLERVWLSSKCG